MSKTSKRTEVKGATAVADKAAIGHFEKALQLLHREQWAEAAKAFAQAAEADPGSSVAERARVFREVCRQKLSNEPVIDDDLYLVAVVAKNAGDLDTALETCNRGGLKGKDPRFTYLAAAIESLRGNREESAKLLVRAIEMDPVNRVHAFWDPDFADVRKSPEVAPLFTPSR